MLAANGLVTSDSIVPLRARLDGNKNRGRPDRKRPERRDRTSRDLGHDPLRTHPTGNEPPASHRLRAQRQGGAGRWSVLEPQDPVEDSLETRAFQLLRRYGVVFPELLARERMAPRWRDLVRVYRTAGGERGDPGRKVRIRFRGRAVRAARCGNRTEGDPPGSGDGSARGRLRLRSAEPGRGLLRRGNECRPSRGTGWFSETACRWRRWREGWLSTAPTPTGRPCPPRQRFCTGPSGVWRRNNGSPLTHTRDPAATVGRLPCLATRRNQSVGVRFQSELTIPRVGNSIGFRHWYCHWLLCRPLVPQEICSIRDRIHKWLFRASHELQ